MLPDYSLIIIKYSLRSAERQLKLLCVVDQLLISRAQLFQQRDGVFSFFLGNEPIFEFSCLCDHSSAEVEQKLPPNSCFSCGEEVDNLAYDLLGALPDK